MGCPVLSRKEDGVRVEGPGSVSRSKHVVLAPMLTGLCAGSWHLCQRPLPSWGLRPSLINKGQLGWQVGGLVTSEGSFGVGAGCSRWREREMRKESFEQGRVGGDDGTLTRGRCSPAASAAVGRTGWSWWGRRAELKGQVGRGSDSLPALSHVPRSLRVGALVEVAEAPGSLQSR